MCVLDKLSILPSPRLHFTSAKERGLRKEGRGKPILACSALQLATQPPTPLCFLFPAATYSQVTQLHPGRRDGRREERVPALLLAATTRQKEGRGKSWLLNQHFSPCCRLGADRLAGWLHGRRLSWQKVKASKDSTAEGGEKKARVAQPKPR